MTLDTSIPFRALQGMYNPADTVQQAASLKDLVQQQQLRGLQIQDAMDARQRRGTLSAMLAQAADPKTGKMDYTKVRSAYAQAGDIEGVTKAEDMLAKMDDRQRAEAKTRAETLAAAAQSLRGLPYEQRRAALMQMTPTLEPLGLSAEQLQGFDPTDTAIDGISAQVLGLKGLLDKQHQDRTYNLDVEKFGETKRSNTVREGISQAELNLRRQKATQQDSTLPKPPPGYRYTANGDLEAIPGGPAANKAGSMTQQQATDGFNASRLQGAQQTISALEGDGSFNPTFNRAGAMAMNSKAREYQAAKGEWSDALIRLTTGAAATETEMRSVDETYFPQFGDSPEVVQRKAAMRERVMSDAVRRAGPGMAGGDAVTLSDGWSVKVR